MADIFNDDFRDFITALNDSEVEYILVGGYSVILHGYRRVTGDMDIWVKKSSENYLKICNAFAQFGMSMFDMTEKKFLSGHEDSEVFRFGISPTRIDLMTVVKGLEFQEAFDSAEWFFDDNVKLRVINYQYLLESKKASNRDKDILDIRNLEKNKKKK